ncbi:hypothetical protein HPB48_009131 [Haemaphysalis longicornis]|uniref:Uncharacterized protein n=1 Tax=Haemaphysalis longicornis TaxID=44386 RepID=A0A9J6GZ86_HAELO|nr:hypothetical protein HPB48_009131 [Haemaphysalis longicornis]
MHFMIHYPRIISQLGPLTQYWCMRFEAKHQYFKRLASRVMNFRNVCRTLADRHQLLQAFQLYSASVGGDVSSTCGKQVKREALADVIQDKVAEEDVIREVKSFTYDHNTDRQGDVLIMKKGQSPKFSLVHAIYTTGKEVLLLLLPLEVLCFRRHRYSYHVQKKPRELYVASPGQEVSSQRLDIYFEAEVMPRCEIFL